MRLWFLPAILLIYTLMSVLTLSSIAPSLAPRQLVYFLVGGVIFFGVSRLSFTTMQRYGWLAYLLTCMLQILTLFIGFNTRNTTSWIPIGNLFNIQPSQLAVPFVGLLVAHFAATYSLSRLKHLLWLLVLIAIPGFFILIEPDLGSVTVYLLSLSSIVFLQSQWKHLALLVGVTTLGVAFAWQFVLHDYQRERITSFTSSEQNLTDAGYNARQSLIAVGAGELFGSGLGEGIQSHLRFLPERQTDFIFASLAEEFGFLGSSLVLFLYAALILFCIRLAIRAPSKEARFFSYIIATMLVIQTGVNISMNMGLLPITGLTLPLLSYGGSSVLAICGSLGLIQAIARETPEKVTLHVE